MAERFPIPCCLHGKGCGVTGCDGMASVPDIPIRGEDGETLYYPRCYKAGAPLLLDPITAEEFRSVRYKAKSGECELRGAKCEEGGSVEKWNRDSDEELTKIAKPELSDLTDCKRFVSELAETIEREYKSKIHNHGQAVDYILTGAKSGDLFFEDCKIARQIRTDRNWERSTFFNYSKPKHLPKPKNLRKAARKRATQKRTWEELKKLVG